MNPYVRRHSRPAVRCNKLTSHGRCRRRAVFPSGRCGDCEEARQRRDFAVLDSYLAEMREQP